MGSRLSKIYTRTGDKGTTGMGDGTRVDKDDARVEAIGDIDELNSVIGMVLAQGVPESIAKSLTEVQHDLFNLGGELSIPGYTILEADRTRYLEDCLDALNGDLPPLEEFILPGGGQAAAACHFARTVCRRAERRLVTLMNAAPVQTEGLSYLNRLSDLLFVAARVIARSEGGTEVLWQRERT